ncbi:tetratricopeptide repeat protein [Chryseolinea sp. H1M3-3]|uniref:tetratricopeptide repeat protein n=1 Tax=Chryseolinea sp. H1M3-3 TaxID=3034144 RepID=UPI0023EB798D|nr:tetratricopeptide repeat protein [Chryseolinea sp. H1M3-3]
MKMLDASIKVVLILVLFSIQVDVFSQTQKIDSLKSLLPHHSGGERIDILFEISRQYLNSNQAGGLYFAKEAFSDAKEFGDSMRIVKTGRVYAQGLRRIGKLDSAQILLKKLLTVASRHAYRTEMKTILNALGVAYLDGAKYDEALKFFLRSLELREEDKDKWEISVALANIGLVYLGLDYYDNAIHYFDRAIKLKIDAGRIADDLYLALINKSMCLVRQKNYREAQKVIGKVLSDCINCSENIPITGYQTLGLISLQEGDLNLAKARYQHSYELSRNSQYKRNHIISLINLIVIHTDLDELESAEDYLREAEMLAKIGSLYSYEMSHMYFRLILAYRKLNNIEKTSFYQAKYISLRDSIFNEDLATNLMKIEAEHLEKENKAKIEAQNAVLALNQEVMLRQKYINVFIGIVALLFIALITMLVKSNRQKQKINQLLDMKVRERTQELENNRDALQRACEERDILIDKTSNDIRNSMATIKGLCSVGLKDVNDPVALQYIAKMDNVTDKFSATLSMLYSTKRK